MNKIELFKAFMEMFGSDDASASSGITHPLVGKYVIVRSRDSGVHAGVLAEIEGRHVSLRDSRRLWYWVAAKEHTLSAVSLYGLGDGCKIASAVPAIEILDACEVIPCSEAARASIQGVKSHDPK